MYVNAEKKKSIAIKISFQSTAKIILFISIDRIIIHKLGSVMLVVEHWLGFFFFNGY